MFEDGLLGALKASELLKERTEKIREKHKELRQKFSKSQINEIRKSLYEIENERNLKYEQRYKNHLEFRITSSLQ